MGQAIFMLLRKVSLDAKKNVFLEVLNEDETQVTKNFSNQEAQKSEGEAASSPLLIPERAKDIISTGKEEPDIQETLDLKEAALLEESREDRTQVTENLPDQEVSKSESEAASSPLLVSEEPKDTTKLEDGDEFIGEAEVESLFQEKSFPSVEGVAEFTVETLLSVGESSSPKKNTMEKMYRNAEEAISTHLKECAPEEKKVFLNIFPSMETLMNSAKGSLLQFEHNVHGAIGKRRRMEDAHFYNELPSGTFMGVLDGHGGPAVSIFAAEMFPKLFEKMFSQHGKDVYTTFQAMIQRIEQEVENNESWNKQGTVGVVCFVDPSTRLIYTATFGDCEATIYRQVDEQLKAIPLSCLRNWSSPKEAQRLVTAWPSSKLEGYTWASGLASKVAKTFRYPPTGYGVNVSRAIGDVYCKKEKENQEALNAISEKPKISVQQLEPDDVVILGCDGLHDFVRQDQIIGVLSAGSFETAAYRLVDAAIDDYESEDNVTVLALRVK